MGRKFNPAPGWPVPWGFEPPPGWEPDPAWPPAPPDWPLWIGTDVPRAAHHGGPAGSYVPGYPHEPPFGAGSYPPQRRYDAGYGFLPPPPRRINRTARSLIAVAALVVLVVVAGIVIDVIGAAHRSPTTGHIDKKGRLDVFSLHVGDCFQSPSVSSLRSGFANVRAVPCTIAHNAQVFGQFRAADPGAYPGHSDLFKQANRGCVKRLDVLERSKTPHTIRLGWIFPDQFAWFQGRRTISCFVRDSKRDLTTSLVKASAIG